MIVPQSFHAVQHRRWRTSAPAPGAMPAVGSMRAGARVVARTRSRLRGAAARRADGDRHARALRARHRGHRKPRRRHLRRLRLVRRCCCSSTSAGRCAIGSATRRARGGRLRLLSRSATLASRTTWLAAAAMALVGFGVLFAGVVSSVLAGATHVAAALVHPAGLAARARLGDPRPARRLGPGLGRVAAGDRAAVAGAGARPAAQARSPPAGRWPPAARGGRLVQAAAPRRGAEHDDAVAAADEAVAALHATFFATPYRPTGLSTAARAVVRLVDELRWLNAIVVQTGAAAAGGAGRPRGCARQGGRRRACSSAAPTCSTRRGARPDRLLPARRTRCAPRSRSSSGGDHRGCPVDRRATSRARSISALDPSFRAQELSFAVSQIAAQHRPHRARPSGAAGSSGCSGRQPAGLAGPARPPPRSAPAPTSSAHSVWLHNSVRGAVGLGLAVLVADLSGVQHSFWVVLGTLSVLRSNALSTGQNALRGAARHGRRASSSAARSCRLIGTNTTLLWLAAARWRSCSPGSPRPRSRSPPGQAAFTLTAADPLQHHPAGRLAGRAACGSRTSRSAAR